MGSLLFLGLAMPALAQRVAKHTYSVGIQVHAISLDMQQNFYQLPLSGKLNQVPWRGDYWPTSSWEIARQYQPQQKATLPTLHDLKTMTREQLFQLSPAEKYDIARGDFDYTLTKIVLKKFEKTVEKYGSRFSIPSWEGLCHGWANASLNFPKEPGQTLFKTENGLSIPFGSHDIKGLLAWFQGEWGSSVAPDTYRINRISKLGKTCPFAKSNPAFADNQDCKDISAAAFHTIIANQIGIKKTGLVMDVVEDDPVWNHPIHQYNSQIISYGRNLKDDPYFDLETYFAEASKVIEVKTTLVYPIEIAATPVPHGPDYEGSLSSMHLHYYLALDARGHIVDSRWHDDSARPDTIWIYHPFNFAHPEAPDQQILSSTLEKIYQQSIAE